MARVVLFGGVDCVEDGCEGGADEGEERGGEGVEEEGTIDRVISHSSIHIMGGERSRGVYIRYRSIFPGFI